MKGYIYQIYCTGNQKSYIGQTINFQTRCNRHKNELFKNKHPNPKLQAAYNKYGEDSFFWKKWEFEIQNQEELNQLEIDFIKKYDSYNNGFNLTEGGDSPPNHQRLSDEILSYCLCVLFEYEWCGHSIEEALGENSNSMAPLKRGEKAPKAWELYNSYTAAERKEYADKYYKEWNIAEIKARRASTKSNGKVFTLTQTDYNNCFAARELGYGYTCVATYYGINPNTVKDWFNGRARAKNKQIYDNLSETEKQQIKDNLPIEDFQRLENVKEKQNRLKASRIKIAE